MSDSFEPVVSSAALEPVRPADRDSTSAPGSRGPGLLARPRIPVRRCGRPPQAHHAINAPRRSTVTYVDRTLNCVDCGVEFIHSAADQEYYVQKGFASATRSAARAAAPAGEPPATAATTSATSAARAATSAATTARPRVLRRRLLVVRQPGAGAVPAAHGPPGLLLRLLPDRPPGLTVAAGRHRRHERRPGPRARPSLDPEHLPARNARGGGRARP